MRDNASVQQEAAIDVRILTAEWQSRLPLPPRQIRRGATPDTLPEIRIWWAIDTGVLTRREARQIARLHVLYLHCQGYRDGLSGTPEDGWLAGDIEDTYNGGYERGVAARELLA